MTILEQMYDKACDRTERNPPSLVDMFPSLYDLKETTLIGSFSWTGLSTHKRMIHYPTHVRFYDQIVTPGDIARDYIMAKYPKRLRCTTSQYHEFKKHRHAPLFANPGYLDSADYIDLKSAYWSILKVIGWDVEYMPGKYLISRSDNSDFPFPDNRLSRNCLVTSGVATSQRMWLYRTQELMICDRGNTIVNSVLYGCIMDILNCIASDAIAAGAQYVHTDGYICHSTNTPAVMSALASWGLLSAIKRTGSSMINCAGSYSVGTYHTRTNVQTVRPTRAVQNLVSPDWLRDRFRKLAGL